LFVIPEAKRERGYPESRCKRCSACLDSGFALSCFSCRSPGKPGIGAPRNDDCSIVKKPTLRRPCSLRRRVRRRRPACAGPSLLLPRHEGSGAPKGASTLRATSAKTWRALWRKGARLPALHWRRSPSGVGPFLCWPARFPTEGGSRQGLLLAPGDPWRRPSAGFAKTCPRAPHRIEAGD